MSDTYDQLVEKAAHIIDPAAQRDAPMLSWWARDVARAALEAVGLPELLAVNEQLRESVNRQFGEPLDEVYKTDGVTIVMNQIHDLRRERDSDREKIAAALALCGRAVEDMRKHAALTTIAPDHRPCESGARAKFAESLAAVLGASS